MPLLRRPPDHHPVHRWVAALAIGVICAGVGVGLRAPVAVFRAVRAMDRVFYDSFYKLRPAESVAGGPIVIVAVDDESIKSVARDFGHGWPWPRSYWGRVVSYVDMMGARAVVFDMLFDYPAIKYPGSNDDAAMAEAIDAARSPTVLATVSEPDGSVWPVAPPIANKVVGVANISAEGVIRSYAPNVRGRPSLARQAALKAGVAPPDWANGEEPFFLKYYGPHVAKAGGPPVTFKYVSAADVLAAEQRPTEAARFGITDETFKDKIVFVAAITAGAYDLKASPLSARYPGVEVHATALQNMITGQRVTPVGAGGHVLLIGLATLVAGAGTVIPQRFPLKVLGGLAGAGVVLGATVWLFLRADVRWLAPSAALVATTLAAFGGLAWSYLTELRQRQLIAKAFAQYVSKEVVDEMLRDPRKIALSGDRRDMTVMFSDIANFTGVSETLDVEGVARMLNYYLEEMSAVILEQNGTLDKYIGDSIMSFWNAPSGQPDHARRACHAALAMRGREDRVAAKLAQLAGGPVYSRFGINSGPMIVGNMGSSAKFNYTVLGDSVNLASRLEGANKLYGTRILITQATAELIGPPFVVRKVDLLRVKGKQRPMLIYELCGEGQADAATLDRNARYERALGLYHTRAFDEAYDLLRNLLKDCPADGPTATLIGRIEHFRVDPPPVDWDGVYVAKDK